MPPSPALHSPAAVQVSVSELAERTIRRSDLVAAENAFIDCRTPGSEKKLNYAIIGSACLYGAKHLINRTTHHCLTTEPKLF